MNVDKTGGTKLPTSFTYTLSAQVYVNRRPCTDAESATKHPLPRRAKPAAGEGWGGGKPNRFTTNIEAPAENVGHKYTIHKVPLSSELLCWVSSMRDKNSLRKQESRLFPNPPAETKHALLPPPQPSPAADADASCGGGGRSAVYIHLSAHGVCITIPRLPIQRPLIFRRRKSFLLRGIAMVTL